MFCLKCAEAIPDGSEICPKCGANLKEELFRQTVVYASQKSENTISKSNATPRKKTSKKIIVIVAVCLCLCIVASFLIWSSIGKSELKNAITKQWMALDESGIFIKTLTIDEDEITYRIETGIGYMDNTLATCKWKAIGSNKIKVERFDDIYETYTIYLDESDAGEVMRIVPSFTDSKESELWFFIK